MTELLVRANQRTPAVLERLADLSYRRRGRIVLAWAAVLVSVFVICAADRRRVRRR
jgi:hypothetical protein